MSDSGMARNDKILLEGFLSGLTRSMHNCYYLAYSDDENLWWEGYHKGKNLVTRDEVMENLLTIVREIK
jgi:hypothetical protein